MNRSFFQRYFGAIILITIGGWFILKQFGLVFFSFGQIFSVMIGVGIILYGIDWIKGSQKSDQQQSESDWNRYNPTMPPPPPPPSNTPFSESGLDGSQFNNQTATEQGQGEGKTYPTYGSQAQDYTSNQYQSNTYSTNSCRKSKSKRYDYDDGDSITSYVFIGDMNYGKHHWELRNMDLSAFIGDMTIDLTTAHVPFGETTINISSFIGDVKIFVPNDVTIGVNVALNAFIGDMKMMKDKKSIMFGSSAITTPNYYESERKINIVVNTFIGDVKVKKVG